MRILFAPQARPNEEMYNEKNLVAFFPSLKCVMVMMKVKPKRKLVFL